MKHYFNNHFIKIGSIEEAKEVIDFWKSVGYETTFNGKLLDYSEDFKIYYGVKNFKFSNFYKKEIYNSQIYTLKEMEILKQNFYLDQKVKKLKLKNKKLKYKIKCLNN
jgi:hypothetical protein